MLHTNATVAKEVLWETDGATLGTEGGWGLEITVYMSSSQYGGRNRSCSNTSTQKQGQTQKKTGECQSNRTYRQLAVILWRPRTCLLIQHKEKRKYKRGGRGRENKTQMWSKPHTTTETRRRDSRERHYGTVTVTTDCDTSGQDLRDRFLPTAVPAYCVSHKLSRIRTCRLKFPWNTLNMSFRFESFKSRLSTRIRI